MPCWYYDKKELKNTASARDGIDVKKEARYRREGARFIIDTGTRMGLRYDTCATGVVYFHRFYMFYSFKDFPRYVTAACCLFLAGKVEETPKKCKDLIKATRGMLTEAQFNVFGDDPKEEVMMLERILLQSLKFDLGVEHPYAFLLKYAKLIKGDKAKVQNMVQMAWTFVNDSLCTTLSLQWEPDTIAVALMYLASRLKKIDIQDWQGKPPAYRGKWWEFLIEDVSLELLEDICHQVLDLYSSTPQAKEDSPPPAPGTKPQQKPTKTSGTFLKRPDSQTNLEAAASKTQATRPAPPAPPPAKVAKVEVKNKRSRTRSPSPAPSHRKVKPQTPVKDEVVRPASTAPPTSQTAAPTAAYPGTQPPYPSQPYTSTYPAAPVSAPATATTPAATTYTTYPPPPHAAQYTQPPSQTATSTQYPQAGYQAPGYQQGTTYQQPYQQQYAQQPQAQTAQQPAAYNQQQTAYNQYPTGQAAQYGQYPQAANYSQYPNASYNQYPNQQQPFPNQQQYAAYSGHQAPYRPPAPPQPAQQPTQQPAQQQQPYTAGQAYPARPPAPMQPYTQPPRPQTLPQQPASSAAPSGPGLPTVRITGRR